MNRRYFIFGKSILVLSVMFFLLFNAMEPVKSAKKNGTMAWTIKWQGLTCTGTYNGELKDGKPHGDGKFEGEILMDEEEIGTISYVGQWKNGCLHGDGKLKDTMSGRHYEGSFRKNMLHGKVKIYQENDTKYILSEYKKDVLCNVTWACDGDQYIEQDRFYRGMSVNQLQNEAEEIEYQKLLLQPDDFLHHKIKVSGEVAEQYDVEESGHEVIVMIASGECYILRYDLSFSATATNYMPFLEDGDSIVVYGFYAGTDSMNGGEVLYPCIEAVSMQWLNKENYDLQNLKYEYEDFLNYPYEYKDKEIELSGIVAGVQSITEKWIYFLLESDNFSNEKKKYICKIKNTKDWVERLPAMGGELREKGLLDLNWCHKDGDDCRFYPCVELIDNAE